MNKNVHKSEAAPRRRRRTAEVARREILDAAKKRLMEGGPDNVRLKQIGEEIGLSHSSILHHFGSRDALMEALREDAFGALAQDLAARLATPGEGDPTIDFFEKVAETLGQQGYGRLLAWQMMSGNVPNRGSIGRKVLGPDGSGGLLRGLAGHLQKMREGRAKALGQPEPDLEETRRVVAMIGCFALGEALAGHLMVRSAGLGSEPEDRRVFRAWVAKLTERALFPEVPEADRAQPRVAGTETPDVPRGRPAAENLAREISSAKGLLDD